MKALVWVGLGGGLGSIIRYSIGLAFQKFTFPFSTLLVNVLGSFLIGILFAWTQKNTTLDHWVYLLGISGFCGGFTTFSTFSLDTLLLLEKNNLHLAFLNVFLSVGICLGAVASGYFLSKFLLL